MPRKITLLELIFFAPLCVEEIFWYWWFQCSNAAFSFGALGQDWKQTFNLPNYLKAIGQPTPPPPPLIIYKLSISKTYIYKNEKKIINLITFPFTKLSKSSLKAPVKPLHNNENNKFVNQINVKC